MLESTITLLIVSANILIALLKFWHDNEEYKRAKEASKTADDKADHIIQLTNSTLTEAYMKIQSLELKVEELIRIAKEKK